MIFYLYNIYINTIGDIHMYSVTIYNIIIYNLIQQIYQLIWPTQCIYLTDFIVW